MLLLASSGRCESAHYDVFVFGNGSKPLAHGTLAPARFRQMFLEDYVVAAERIETPRHARIIGVLVAADNSIDQAVAIPLCNWRTGAKNYFSCQSSIIGQAPRLAVLAGSKSELLETIHAVLNETHPGEPVKGGKE